MKNPPLIGLVVTGNIARSWISRAVEHLDRLGPIVSSSFRLSNRIANTLRAGVPAEQYDEFNCCKVILIRVAEDELHEVLAGLAAAQIQWREKTIILCDTVSDSSEWDELERRGASVATLTYLRIGGDDRYVVEGDPKAIHNTVTALALPPAQVVEIGRSRKALYLACRKAASMVVPLAAAADEELRRAGVQPDKAAWMVEQWLQDGLRAYRKNGRRAWNGDWIAFRKVMDSAFAGEDSIARIPPGANPGRAKAASADR
jgi:predicted short-subunit dehydrogenase-like oxidoreductase (DUF2520 family)